MRQIYTSVSFLSLIYLIVTDGVFGTSEETSIDFANNEEESLYGSTNFGRHLATSFFGSLYVDGVSIGLQYFDGDFGSKVHPVNEVKLVYVENMCITHDENSCLTHDTTPIAIVTKRGFCSFGQKAVNAKNAGAESVIFINTLPGNFHVPAPSVQDIEISISMINSKDGSLLIEALQKENYRNGLIVPYLCDALNDCGVLVPDHDDWISNLQRYEGTLVVKKSSNSNVFTDSFSFLQAEFGYSISSKEAWDIVLAEPLDACNPLNNSNEVSNKAVLVSRGSCEFGTKASVLTYAGAGMMVLVNNSTDIFRMGVEPRDRAYNFDLSAIQIGSDAGETLMWQLNQQNSTSLSVEIVRVVD
mmetsp:Transcript_3610/g.5249  ORF Transcript_3610/g.5249 Transcript_3610/m.5249 type:complete len:358 (+) Transcript_3610:306-1379(+)